MSQKNETKVLLLSLLVTAGLIAGGVWWLGKSKVLSFFQGSNISSPQQNEQNTSPETTAPVDSQPVSSQGDSLLIAKGATSAKEAGIQAFAVQDFPSAISNFEQSLRQRRNDPETLIYLNNARIGQDAAHTIAVPIPIGTEETTAEEILRGVAQAQDEINRQGGINGTPLQVTLINDNNDPNTAQKVAQDLVKDQNILGVVGHFSSGVTLAAAPIYQKNGLVAISATSTSVAISTIGNSIFRTVPSDRFTSNALVKYALDKLNKNQAAVIYNSQSAYSKSLRDNFSTDFASNGGAIALEVDLAQGNFNPATVLQNATNNNVDVLVFLNDSKTFDQAYLVLSLNNQQLPTIAGDSFYKSQTLEIVGQQANGMVLGVPWHILASNQSDFPNTSQRLWGGDVSWRTAMAYDATKALAAGLAQTPTRQGIQQTLSQSGFSFNGASGIVRFLASGDRNSSAQLVIIQPGQRSSYGFDFVPIE